MTTKYPCPKELGPRYRHTRWLAEVEHFKRKHPTPEVLRKTARVSYDTATEVAHVAKARDLFDARALFDAYVALHGLPEPAMGTEVELYYLLKAFARLSGVELPPLWGEATRVDGAPPTPSSEDIRLIEEAPDDPAIICDEDLDGKSPLSWAAYRVFRCACEGWAGDAALVDKAREIHDEELRRSNARR